MSHDTINAVLDAVDTLHDPPPQPTYKEPGGWYWRPHRYEMAVKYAIESWINADRPRPVVGHTIHPRAMAVLKASHSHYGSGLVIARHFFEATNAWRENGYPLYAETPAPTTDAEALQFIIDRGLEARSDWATAVARALYDQQKAKDEAQATLDRVRAVLANLKLREASEAVSQTGPYRQDSMEASIKRAAYEEAIELLEAALAGPGSDGT